MIKILLLACLFTVVDEYHNQDGHDRDIRRILVSWNKATLNSLKKQYKSSGIGKDKAMYAERLSEFERENECRSEVLVDTMSLRYKFMAILLPKMKNCEVFIVEANRMGAKAIVRNYVVWKKKDGTAKVDYYFFSNGSEWLKEDFAMTLPKPDISLPLSNYLVKSTDGFNSDDVIISHFDATEDRDVTSEFFSLGTLSRKCAVKDM